MDPTHHEKIVDKLMQYRGKIPKHGQLSSKNAQYEAMCLRRQIDMLILAIECYAKNDDKGLIR